VLYCILQSELYVFVVAEAIKHSVCIELDKLCSILCIGEECSTHILCLCWRKLISSVVLQVNSLAVLGWYCFSPSTFLFIVQGWFFLLWLEKLIAVILMLSFLLALLVGKTGALGFFSISGGSCNFAPVGAVTENQECWQPYWELCVPSRVGWDDILHEEACLFEMLLN